MGVKWWKLGFVRKKKKKTELFKPLFKNIISVVSNSIKNQAIIYSFIYDV